MCKHAGPTMVSVRLTYRPDALLIVVDNAAPAHTRAAAEVVAAQAGDGHGLIGMRERVTALGGTLRAGPRPDGGYRVTAALPTTAGSPA